jgi:hypothetical protein
MALREIRLRLAVHVGRVHAGIDAVKMEDEPVLVALGGHAGIFQRSTDERELRGRGSREDDYAGEQIPEGTLNNGNCESGDMVFTAHIRPINPEEIAEHGLLTTFVIELAIHEAANIR